MRNWFLKDILIYDSYLLSPPPGGWGAGELRGLKDYLSGIKEVKN